MATGHVYADSNWLTSARMAEKRRVARAAGARFASVRFVTGALDPFECSADFHAAAAMIPRERLQLIWGAHTPRKSKAEMAALAQALQTTPVRLPRGKLGVHEEFAPEVAEPVLNIAPSA